MTTSYPYRLQAAHSLDADTLRILLRPHGHGGMPIQAGQFFSLALPNGAARSYSLACQPRGDGWLEAHIRLRRGGRASEWLRTEAKPGQTLTVSGPYGDCVWQPESSSIQRVLMLATGTGIAPLKAMLEYAAALGCRTPITLYWGGARPQDLYLADHFACLALRWPTFRFVPVLSEAPAGWLSRQGWVQQAAAADHPDLRAARVYACGAPAMVEQARELLVSQCGLPEDRFHADAFAPAQTAAPSSQDLSLRWRAASGDWQQLPAASGSRLVDALAAAGLVLPVCGGQAACGACRVEIDAAWSACLPAPERQEKRLLAVLDHHRPAHRLACQIRLHPGLNGLTLFQ
ncbi:FAD-binding oxidoreductase [Chromobacterium sp. IIBBL 290-4]|uniref:FAD-binding oxidoreductase n=1 Tax=Chromobacterium sp. IIBBL 290-4 TaxID=2953890 RepID=UPI0020B7A68F|nr:FAD-binding oxidoreductase [Chromobacterium sp. IIBBL 290-4]UTH75910.1 FAD-binding oxidoreductase [Chromobacterium sp. IIBBL 290-4]